MPPSRPSPSDDTDEPPALRFDDDKRLMRYEGDVFVRPLGKGIDLEDAGDEVESLEHAVELLLERVTGRSALGNGTTARLRMRVELLED